MPAKYSEPWFGCDVCGKAFGGQLKLRNHARMHNRPRNFVCQVCSKCFINRSLLESHTRTVHTDERPFNCGFCEKSFADKRILTRHVRIHTNERPFQCDFCYDLDECLLPETECPEFSECKTRSARLSANVLRVSK